MLQSIVVFQWWKSAPLWRWIFRLRAGTGGSPARGLQTRLSLVVGLWRCLDQAALVEARAPGGGES